mmetsp:Transcript_11246/g.28172  ORF Transcript_11246/g.28172 Transcript_11246/m.28172 type:complete len:215 (-) Transcript_11246:42-686(-)
MEPGARWQTRRRYQVAIMGASPLPATTHTCKRSLSRSTGTRMVPSAGTSSGTRSSRPVCLRHPTTRRRSTRCAASGRKQQRLSPAAGAAAESLALAESLSLSLSLALKLQCSPVVPEPEPEPGAGPGFAPAPSLEPCAQVPRGGSRRGPDGGLRRVCARARDHEAEVAHEIARQRLQMPLPRVHGARTVTAFPTAEMGEGICAEPCGNRLLHRS